MNDQNCKLYLISPPVFELNEFEGKLREAFKGGTVPVFQLRMKSHDQQTGEWTAPADEGEIAEAVERLMPIAHENGCNFILNDNVKLAKELGCNGVHLGGGDMSVKEARKILGKNAIIGASCYASKDKAFEAGEQGADYVAFGAFYETQTKKPKGRPSPDLLKFWNVYTDLPCVAIGGIKVDNCKPLVKAGADFIAVVTGVWDYEKGVAAAVKDFNLILEKN